MAQCVVIADEITGASAVGALLQKNKTSVCSLVSSRGLKDPLTKDFDCIVYSTNSRNLTPTQSYQIVFYAGKLLKSDQIKLYAKRIDPAMRGNTCAETQALLDSLGDNDRMAIVVPAFPELRRSNIGGYILVDGKPVQKSLVGLEDLMPAASGRVADLFIEKFRYPAEPIFLKDLFHGADYLANKLKALRDKGIRAVVFDCTSQQDITTIADAVIKSGIKFLAVDPGPFTATMARKVSHMEENTNTHDYKILGILGGSNPMIAAQVEVLGLEEKALFVPIKSLNLIEDEQKRTAEIEKAISTVLSKSSDYNTIFIISDHLGANAQILSQFDQILEKNNRTRLEALDLISSSYGQIIEQIIDKTSSFKAIYSAGAEYTAAICREFRALGLDIQGQVTPLTAYGHLIGGPHHGLQYVASASSATDPDTLLKSVQYLRRKMSL